MTAIKAELYRYFEDQSARARESPGFIRWLRKPSSFAARLVVAVLLILGGSLASFQCWASGCFPWGFF